MQGDILLSRKLLDSSVFASEKRLKVWIWLLLKASYKSRFVPIKIGKGETTIEIMRGQLLFGRFSAEESLNIDGSTIYKILKAFEKDEMIDVKSNSHYTIISICNYDIYQQLDKSKVTATKQPSNSQVTADEQPRNTYNKVNKDNKDNKDIYIAKIQDEFYATITPFISEYSKETLREFYNYWSEPNKSKTKIKWQLEKTWDLKRRLERWVNNDFKKNKFEPEQQPLTYTPKFNAK